jgi:hypothetical protein
MRIKEIENVIDEELEIKSILVEFNFLGNVLSKVAPKSSSDLSTNKAFKTILKNLRQEFLKRYGFAGGSKLTYENAIRFAKGLKVDPEFINSVLKDYKRGGGFENITSDQQIGKKEQIAFFAAIAAGIVEAGGINKVAPGEYKPKEDINDKTSKDDEKVEKPDTTLPAHVQSKLDKLSPEQKQALLGMLQ